MRMKYKSIHQNSIKTKKNKGTKAQKKQVRDKESIKEEQIWEEKKFSKNTSR